MRTPAGRVASGKVVVEGKPLPLAAVDRAKG